MPTDVLQHQFGCSMEKMPWAKVKLIYVWFVTLPYGGVEVPASQCSGYHADYHANYHASFLFHSYQL